ncbi:hypothetical protein [Sorangium sp. So ce1024]|uniref:hypothetical protein n=1 Tax=Sorangium sp. So ce1024 TaxID=3133327 RepID=UPI003F079523
MAIEPGSGLDGLVNELLRNAEEAASVAAAKKTADDERKDEWDRRARNVEALAAKVFSPLLDELMSKFSGFRPERRTTTGPMAIRDWHVTALDGIRFTHPDDVNRNLSNYRKASIVVGCAGTQQSFGHLIVGATVPNELGYIEIKRLPHTEVESLLAEDERAKVYAHDALKLAIAKSLGK